MAFETNELTGALFLNERKERDSQPDFKGTVRVNNTMYWLAAWEKVSKNGTEYMSLALTEMEDQPDMTDPEERPKRPPVKPAAKSATKGGAQKGGGFRRK